MQARKCGRGEIVAGVVRGLLGYGMLSLLGGAGTASAEYSGPAELIDPSCGSRLSSGSMAFRWDDVGASSYSLSIGTSQGSADVFQSPKPPGTATSLTPTPPLDLAKQYWVRLRSLNPSTNKWDVRDCTVGPAYTGPAAISSPRCGGTFESRTPRIEWPDVGAASYRLSIGGVQGSASFFDSGRLPAGSSGVNVTRELPADGRMLWARLQSKNPSTGAWQTVDCQVSTIRPDFVAPSPTCGSVLTGPSETLQWSANGNPNAQEWKLKVGTTFGGAQYLMQDWSPATSATLTDLPGDGSFLFVRLQWRKSDKTGAGFRDCKMLAPTFAPPSLTGANVCDGVLDGPTPTFSWAPGAWNVVKWGIQVGSTPGGSDYLNEIDLPETSASQTVANPIPSDGRPVYVRLRYEPAKIQRSLFHDCITTAQGTPQPPILTSPACGDLLPGSQTQFSWDPRGSTGNVQSWQLLAGSSLGGSEYFDSGILSGTVQSEVPPAPPTSVDRTSALATGLPRDGRSLYVRLRWRQDGVWHSSDCLYPGYKTLNYAVEGAAERSAIQTCETTNASDGKPMPIASSVGCATRTCEPPVPPLEPRVPGNLAFPRLGLTTKGSPTGEPNVFTGTWALTGNYVSVCDGKRVNETLNVPNFAVSQTADGSLSGKLRTIVVPPLFACSYACTAPGQCTLSCPDAQNLRCSVTCTPATDFCDRESNVSGRVAPDGSIALSIKHRQEIDYDCGPFGTIHMEDLQGQEDDPATSTDESRPGLELQFPAPTRVVN